MTEPEGRRARLAIFVLIVTAILAPEASAQESNLALGKTVARSSDCSCGRATAAVDGNTATFWQPLSADRTDDLNVWLLVDLGTTARIDRAVLNFRTNTADIVEIRIRTSNDEITWQTAYTKHRDSAPIDMLETASFPPVIGRYVRLDLTLSTGGVNLQLNELEVYGIPGVPPPSSGTNLALGRPVTQSSDCSCGRATAAVDGDPATFWQPLSGDRTADRNVWLRVDLGAPSAVEYAVLKFRTSTADIVQFQIRTSDDDSTWQISYSKHRDVAPINAAETATFPSVTARYVRIDFTLGTGSPNFQLNELELYAAAPPPVLASVRLEDTTSRVYAPGETVSLVVGATLRVVAKGTMSNGTEADLSAAAIAFASTKPSTARVDDAGLIEALAAGVTKITASITVDNITREVHLWVDVEHPSMLVADLRLTHPTMTMEIGRPAIVAPGSEYPCSAPAHMPI